MDIGIMELDTLQVMAGIFTAIIGIIGLLARHWATTNAAALQAERVARASLEKDLRGTLDEERAENQALRTRVVDLENREKNNQVDMAELRRELGTVCGQLERVQKTLDETLARLNDKTAENHRKDERIKELERLTDKQDRELGELQVQVRTYERALALVGTERQPKSAQPEAGEGKAPAPAEIEKEA